MVACGFSLPRTSRGDVLCFFWCVTDCEFDGFERELAGDGTVREFKKMAVRNGERLYRVDPKTFRPSQPLVFPLFRKHNITLLNARRNADGLHLHARFPTREALSAFADAAAQIANNCEIRELYAERPAEFETLRLTTKQEAALVLAYEKGYFDVPRQVTLAELAEDLEVTPQTLSRHLRVAVEKAVSDLVEAIQKPRAEYK